MENVEFGPLVPNRADDAVGPIRQKWYYTKEQLQRSPSVQAGISYEKEQGMLRQAASFIRVLSSRINDLVSASNKLTQLSVSVAIIQTRRFFLINRLADHDPRDVGTAALFLSSKCEECPQRLERFILAYYRLRVEVDCPKEEWERNARLDRRLYEQACAYIVWLENQILQTVGFDFNVSVPHTFVITLAGQLFQNAKPFSEVGFWLATDSLHMTDWCVRLKPPTVACVIICLVVAWADMDVPLVEVADADGNLSHKPFYLQHSDELTDTDVYELMAEYTRIYKENEANTTLAMNRFKHYNLKADCTPVHSGTPSPAPAAAPHDEREPGEI